MDGKPDGTVVPPWTGATIDNWIKDAGKYDLLDWMNKYWINQGASNAEFWAHEFAKHATCFSTFDLPCYGPQYVPHQDVIEYFETAVLYELRLPTYKWLTDAGITPSNTTRVALKDVQNALVAGYGKLPFVGCSGPRYNETAAGARTTDNGRTQISETWYYFHVSFFEIADGGAWC
jgi:ribonuclease T2